MTTGYILVPVLALVALPSLGVGTYTLLTLTGLEWLAPVYLGMVGYFGGQLVRAGLAYLRVTRADSPLTTLLGQIEAEDRRYAQPAEYGPSPD